MPAQILAPSPLLQYRHVIFPSALNRRKKVINYGATAEPRALARTAKAKLPVDQAAFVQWLFRQADLDATAYNAETLQRRLPACLRTLRVPTVGEAQRLLERQPALVVEAISAMLVGVTSFFRDPEVFDLLERDLLPAMMTGRSGLYVWSAGCSDGAELYSLGMIFAEKGWLPGSYLVGTDCREDALARARAGLFDPMACKNLPAHLKEQYLHSEGPRWRVVSRVRNALRWRTADLLQGQEPGVWDVILCRNTTMYLQAETANRLWPKFEALLRPGGLLVLGKAERPVGVKRLTSLGPCLYRRIRG